jgi:hypothetical protein
MVDLQLERSPADRRLYRLGDIGTLRLPGFAGRVAVAEAEGRRWSFDRGRFWQRGVEATDETGEPVGRFEPRSIRRGGTVRWSGRELALRPASSWRERYALAEGDRELATFEGKSWGKRPVRVSVDDLEQLDPGLLLFTTFVVRGLAEAADASAGAAASTAAAGGG